MGCVQPSGFPRFIFQEKTFRVIKAKELKRGKAEESERVVPRRACVRSFHRTDERVRHAEPRWWS